MMPTELLLQAIARPLGMNVLQLAREDPTLRAALLSDSAAYVAAATTAAAIPLVRWFHENGAELPNASRALVGLPFLVDADIQHSRGHTILHAAISSDAPQCGIEALLRVAGTLSRSQLDALLEYAVRVHCSHEQFVHVLLDLGAAPSFSTARFAARRNRSTIFAAISKGRPIWSQTGLWGTLLHSATELHNHDTVAWMLDHGYNQIIAEKDVDGRSCIHFANHRIMALLEERGAIADVFSLARGLDPDRLRVELGRRPDVHSLRFGTGETPLHLAAFGAPECADLLIAAGLDREAIAGQGWRPLHVCCKTGNTGVAEVLIEAGAELEAQSNDGMTPLAVAAERNDTAMCRLLIRAGANLEAKDSTGYTPLHYAAVNNASRACMALLAAGADPNATTNDGVTPASLSLSSGSINAATILQPNWRDSLV